MANIYRLGDRVPQIHPTAFIAPNATLIGNVVVEANASIWFNVVIRADNDLIVIGEGTNIQDGAILHTDAGHPLRVGKNVTVGHMAMLHGCTVSDNVIIGVRATVLNGSVIPENTLVAAGALVAENKSYEPGSQLMGAPVKMTKKLDEKVAARIPRAAAHYVHNQQRYTGKFARIPLDEALKEQFTYQVSEKK
ncbi:MAG: gamma carbonic anhydrase family protein [Burkholderiaceae bacterium]|jgi:carbonic anhydrase/acetyltransferase-like protein (isoleucine patch superfamily)|nr:gamma carbonic anhydrase family protein [Burkholderiaceae bacterium]